MKRRGGRLLSAPVALAWAWVAEPVAWPRQPLLAGEVALWLALPAGAQWLLLRVLGVSYVDPNTAHHLAQARARGLAWALLTLLTTVPVEELVFRALPLAAVVRWRRTPATVALVALVASLLYALGHVFVTLVDGASAASALGYLWSRGAGGLVLCAGYLRGGGWDLGWRGADLGLLTVCLAHYAYDALGYVLRV